MSVVRLSTVLLLVSVLSPLYAGELHSGAFQKKKEKIKGTFVIKDHNGQKILELSEDFKTKNGPDLQLVFSPMNFADINGKNALDNGAVSLGLMQSNKGAQTYEIPANVDLSKMKSILIHCVKYTRLWGGAPLTSGK
jgi:hypothetical protein